MSIDDVSGDKLIPSEYNVTRWQHRLFAEIRNQKTYIDLIKNVRAVWECAGRPGEPTGDFTDRDYWIPQPLDRSSAYVHALEKAAIDLHLTRNGTPVEWAISYLHDDVLNRFDPDYPPPMMSIEHIRLIEISISAAVATVDTYSGWDEQRDEVRSSQAQHQLPMMIGLAEWETLEALAVEAARQAVADLRANYQQRRRSTRMSMTTTSIRAGNQRQHNLTIKKLAQRLAGWKAEGDWNNQKTDERWCATVRIDPPKKTRQ